MSGHLYRADSKVGETPNFTRITPVPLGLEGGGHRVQVGSRIKAFFLNSGTIDQDGVETDGSNPSDPGAVFLHDSQMYLQSVIRLEVIENEHASGRAQDKYRLTTRSYVHRLQQGPTTIGWHWHPDEFGGKKDFPPAALRPHMHAYDCDIRKMHIPTGRVGLEDVLIFAVEEFELDPREPTAQDTNGREQAAEDVVKEIERTFQPRIEHRTWHRNPL